MENSGRCTAQQTSAAPAKRSSGDRFARAVSHHGHGSAVRSSRRTCEHRYASCIYNKQPLRSATSLRVLLSVLLIFTTSILGTASASTSHVDRRKIGALPGIPLENGASARKGPSLLVVDTRPPPVVLPLMHQRRDGSPTAAASTKTSIATDPSATASNVAVPRPFDTALYVYTKDGAHRHFYIKASALRRWILSNNFTAPCATFFKRMLSDSGFGDCHPFSLMLQTSSGLFDASKSFFAITRVLEATCSVNSDQCTSTLGGFARDLLSDANCQVDYANQNPLVLQAYNGLVAYQPLYQASCVRDSGGNYCYANAVTNATATTDAYPYYLPLGVALPGGSRPTCNSCLVDVMAIFSSFGGNATQPISKTYNTAAQQINTYCGPNFVNNSATPLKGAASTTTASLAPTLTLFIMLFVLFFQ